MYKLTVWCCANTKKSTSLCLERWIYDSLPQTTQFRCSHTIVGIQTLVFVGTSQHRPTSWEIQIVNIIENNGLKLDASLIYINWCRRICADELQNPLGQVYLTRKYRNAEKLVYAQISNWINVARWADCFEAFQMNYFIPLGIVISSVFSHTCWKFVPNVLKPFGDVIRKMCLRTHCLIHTEFMCRQIDNLLRRIIQLHKIFMYSAIPKTGIYFESLAWTKSLQEHETDFLAIVSHQTNKPKQVLSSPSFPVRIDSFARWALESPLN